MGLSDEGLVFFFFFQAEDGIRDHCVTGVQTCALPISLSEQAKEIDADGWAVMLNVDHWFSGGGRANVLRALKAEGAKDPHADHLLLMFFVTSICATLLLWRPAHIDERNAYQLSHPPQATRMERMLLIIDMWARG